MYLGFLESCHDRPCYYYLIQFDIWQYLKKTKLRLMFHFQKPVAVNGKTIQFAEKKLRSPEVLIRNDFN